MKAYIRFLQLNFTGMEVAESDGKYYAINHHDGKYIEQMLQEPLQRMKKQVFKHSSYRFFNYKTVVSIL
jgi:hypothetical protein